MTPMPNRVNKQTFTYDPSHPLYTGENVSKVVATGSGVFAKIHAAVNDIFEKIKTNLQEMKLEPIFATIHKELTHGEVVMNVISCFPLIGVLGSALRTIAGKIQAIVGVVLTAIGEAGLYLDKKKKTAFFMPFKQKKLRNNFRLLSRFGREQVIHGSLNVFRGSCEIALNAATLGFGNIALIVPNLANGRDFKPFIPYGVLTSRVSEALHASLSAHLSTNSSAGTMPNFNFHHAASAI